MRVQIKNASLEIAKECKECFQEYLEGPGMFVWLSSLSICLNFGSSHNLSVMRLSPMSGSMLGAMSAYYSLSPKGEKKIQPTLSF